MVLASGVAQQIYEPLMNRIKRKPDELKSIVDALKAYVIDFNNNRQVLESDKTLNLFTRSTVIDHTNTNRTKFKDLVNNMTSDDVLDLCGGVVSFTFKPFMQRTGHIVTDKTVPLSRWSIAPFYSPYLHRYIQYGVFAPEALMKRYKLSISANPKDIDYTKPFNTTTNNLKQTSTTATTPVYRIYHNTAITNMHPISNLKQFLYFTAPKDIFSLS